MSSQLTDNQETVLELFAKYKYLTPINLVQLGLFDTAEQARKQALKPLKDSGLIISIIAGSSKGRGGRNPSIYRTKGTAPLRAGYFLTAATIDLWIRLEQEAIEFTPFFETDSRLSTVTINDKSREIGVVTNKLMPIMQGVTYITNNPDLEKDHVYNIDVVYEKLINVLHK
jgi:hypothetical protein